VSNWEMVRVKDVCFNMHQGINTITDRVEYTENGIPIIQSKNITKGVLDLEDVRYVDEKTYRKYFVKYNPQINDVLVCNIGTIGKTFVVTKRDEYLIAWNLFIIRLNELAINSSYFYYLFSYFERINYFDKLLSGGTVKFINKTKIGNIQIPLPPFEIQKNIVKTLDTVTELLAMRNQQLAVLDNLIKSTFYDMFGNPITNELGWSLVKLGELGKLSCSGTPRRTNQKYFLGDIDWYTAGELNHRYLIGSKEKLTVNALTNSSAKVFKKESMLIGLYDTAAFKLGILSKDSSSNQACANIDVYKDSVNIEWLYDCALIMRPFFLKNRRGVRQKNLSLGMIKGFEIPLPPLDLQNQFATRVTKIEEQKVLVKKAIDETQYLFDSLMSEYFG
jgi:type I restriction enzyme S subunit